MLSEAIPQQRVAAVIVTRNRREILMNCLAALLGGDLVPNSVVVVDNASTDGTVDAVRTNWPQVTIVESRDNAGPACGFHRGMAVSMERGCEWIMPLNDDCYVERDALIRLARVAEHADETIGIIAPLVRHGNREDLGYAWRHVPVPITLGPVSRSADVLDADMVTFNAALIRASAVHRLGLPREDYFIMWWEWEYCLRLRAGGLGVLVVPQARVFHLTTGSPVRKSPPWRGYYQARNHLRFVLERRSFTDGIFWCVREGKFALSILLTADRKFERLGLLLQGVADALRGRMGRTIIPS